MLATEKANDWSWVDCLQMSMPVYTRLGVRFKDDRYFTKMHDLYSDSKSQLFQDLFVLNHFNFKLNGYFVEIGAADGIKFSNT